MGFFYFLQSWRCAEEAERDSCRSRKPDVLKSEFLEDVFEIHQSHVLELWHGSTICRTHKLGKEELRCMAQFQGIQVLSIKEAVLMQKKKGGWTTFFQLFFFINCCKADPVMFHQASVGSWYSTETPMQNSHEMARLMDPVIGPCAECLCYPVLLRVSILHSSSFFSCIIEKKEKIFCNCLCKLLCKWKWLYIPLGYQ